MRVGDGGHDAHIIQLALVNNNLSPDRERHRVAMFRYIHFAAFACSVALLASVLAVAPARAQNVLGAWSTPDGRGVVAIEQCGDALCGRIVGIFRAPGEPIPKDVHGAPQCGLTIISKEHPTGDGAWLGQVVDPRTGTVYGAKLWVDDRGDLRLRGFVGLPMLGETQIWHHFAGRLTPACERV